jgi:hypothetical protein
MYINNELQTMPHIEAMFPFQMPTSNLYTTPNLSFEKEPAGSKPVSAYLQSRRDSDARVTILQDNT